MLSNLTILCLDLGLWTENCLRFVRDAGKVLYHVPNIDPFQQPFKSLMGDGMDGMVRVSDFWKHVDKADMIFVPDTTCADLVEYLKKHDYPVCGAGAIERLETDRWYGRNRQKENGLPVQATIKVQGFSDLATLMQEGGAKFGVPNFPDRFFVKVDNTYRGLEESFKHESWEGSEDTVYRMASRLGPYKESIVFVCEELLEGIEPGIDGITWEGKLMYPTMGGYEKKGHGMVSRVYRTPEELPEIYHQTHAGLEPEFRKHKTRFFYSTELRLDKDRIPYLIDPTMRLAGPCTSAMQAELIDNYTEVCYGLATGDRVDPVMKHRYAASAEMNCREAEKDWVHIDFPEKIRQWVKLSISCKKNGNYYALPGMECLGAVIGMGDTLDAAIKQVKDRAGQICAKRVDIDTDEFECIKEDIEVGRKLGVDF